MVGVEEEEGVLRMKRCWVDVVMRWETWVQYFEASECERGERKPIEEPSLTQSSRRVQS